MTEKPRRCAIYTRKSTDEGLDQNFNSLDAQQESCLSYIDSQKSKGWVTVKTKYDDGGFSGGNIERPALKQLMKDISARKIDIVVVYKIDRLTRSLWDFVKLAGLFEKYGVTFVSVTQSFNTTTSMGRLTMNILLSFAQFEREVTVERIRDKIASSKKRGIWLGGTTPTGYDVKDRQLVPNEHATFIRELFELYLKLGDIPSLAGYFKSRNIKSVIRTTTGGKQVGGIFMSTGMLRHILMNPVYIGKIRHKKAVYPGQHPPIIPLDLWERVQERLRERSHATKHDDEFARNPNFLWGKLFDIEGNKYSIAKSTQRSYRYYYSAKLANKCSDHPFKIMSRIRTDEIEGHVQKALQEHLSNPTKLAYVLSADPDKDADTLKYISDNSWKLVRTSDVIEKICVHLDHYILSFKVKKLCAYINTVLENKIDTSGWADAVTELSIPFRSINWERGATAIIEPQGQEDSIEFLFDLPTRDIKDLVRGVAWQEEHFKKKKSLSRIAQEYKVSKELVKKMIFISFEKGLKPYFDL